MVPVREVTEAARKGGKAASLALAAGQFSGCRACPLSPFSASTLAACGLEKLVGFAEELMMIALTRPDAPPRARGRTATPPPRRQPPRPPPRIPAAADINSARVTSCTN